MTTDVPLPPPAYSTPYHGPLQVIDATLPEVEQLCRTQWGDHVRSGYQTLGCQWWKGATCLIVVPWAQGEVTPELRIRVTLHELGHCQGWPADHPR